MVTENSVITKEVYFHGYCNICKHKKVEETEEPCTTCLTYAYREHSHKPEKYELEVED